MWDSLIGKNTFHIIFPVIICVDDLFPFQNFGDFPSCVLGEFKVYIRVPPDDLVWCSVNPSESIKQMAEVYPFTENNEHEIFNYKQFADVITSTQQQNNYDHRFTQVNSFSRASTNCVSDLYQMNAVPTIASYEGVDILLKPRLINIYLAQSIISGYKLQGGYGTYL
jgi:hypothetical protein